ncbi:MAG: thiol oxidoreductase [Flavobacteriales bacterium]|nr:thiol oxidoreductase [Flavobacteriales bacterium]
MLKLKAFILIGCSAGMILQGCTKLVPRAPDSGEVIAEPIEGLNNAQMAAHLVGDERFAHVYSPEEGLGPVFIQTSCEGCHVGDGKGHFSSVVERFGMWENGVFNYLDSLGGPQLQGKAVLNYLAESIPDAGTVVSRRVPPIITGLGFLSAVHDTTLLNLAAKQTAQGNGVSGRVNYVMPQSAFILESHHVDSSGYYIGRFGKKATKATVKEQIVFALKEDMGITSDFDMFDPFNIEVGYNTGDDVPDPELAGNQVNDLVFYLRTLKAPTRRMEDDENVMAGEELFKQVGCAECHISTLKTGYSEIEALSEKEFHPYTDLLIHYMPLLGDGYPEGSASGDEWRTAPLWGLGLAADSQGGIAYYLHDGRATTINQVVNLHLGGEADNAASSYKALTDAEKDQVIAFLNSL